MDQTSEQLSEAAAQEVEDERQSDEWEQAEKQQGTAPVIVQGEAGGNAWCSLWGKVKDASGNFRLVKIDCISERGENSEAALRGLMHTLAVAKEEFHLTPYQPEIPLPQKSQPPAQPETPTASPAPISQQVPVAPQAPAAPAPPQQAQAPQAQENILLAVKEEVKPRPDGKIEVAFYGQGRKFPDLKMIGTPAELAAKFGGGWTPAHFGPGVSTAYNVSLQVVWMNSTRTNQNGQPYKDVVRIA